MTWARYHYCSFALWFLVDMTKFDTSIYILQIAVTMDESFEVHALDESIHEEVPPTPYQCQSCDYTSKYKQNLNRHVRAKHSSSSTSETEVEQPETKLICDHCGRSYKSKFGLKCHIKSKHEKRSSFVVARVGRDSKVFGITEGT